MFRNQGQSFAKEIIKLSKNRSIFMLSFEVVEIASLSGEGALTDA